MSDVPGEILLEILSRLPVVPLLRFRCVSNSWKSLIDSDEFIKQHLDHSKKTNTKLSIILRSRHLYSADFDLLNETNRANFQELTLPLKAPFDRTKILGSCDGLLVLSNDKFHETILWNPSVRRFHELPLPHERFEFVDLDYISSGFGYDVVNDDYKLVRLVQVYGNDKYVADIEVKVYSLKSDSWRRILDFPYHLEYRSNRGEFANGALHWIVRRKVNYTDTVVIAFDLGTEEYRLVPLPEFAGNRPCMYVYVFVLGGCLGLKFYDFDNVYIWVMKEYGVEESWTFLFTFDNSNFNFLTPLAYSKCGRKVLLGLVDQVLMWYDLDKKSTDVQMVQMPFENPYDMDTCLQSLVLLNKKGTCDFDLVTKKKQERKDKKRSCRTRRRHSRPEI